ncbi:MAG: His/Gly/Thr/Pro-type tRNA ligase C-terminal domain-containing protein, partial [Desulfomonilaceae bacterium]
GDPCPRCAGRLRLSKGIEVGHIFKLGVKYSKAMNATFLDAGGRESFMIMGCYGIGVSRVLAAAIEQNHDNDGIIFPPPLAPFTVIVTTVGAKSDSINKAAQKVYDDLWNSNIDTLWDDRDERPGVKFKDADLLGIPFRVTIGQKALAQGNLELRNRKTKQTILVSPDTIVSRIKEDTDQWVCGQ